MSPPVELILLRGLVPDLPVRAGDVLAARVLAREGARGTLLLAGVRMAAQLPEAVAAGDRLRVRVQEIGAERIVLRVVGEAAAPTAGAAPAAAPQPALDPTAAALRAGLAVPLPGGGVARLFVDPEAEPEEGRRGREAARVTLRYEAAAMGRVDLVLELAPGAVTGTVHAPAGAVSGRLRDGAGALRDALAAATARPATVTVRERAETVDHRA